MFICKDVEAQWLPRVGRLSGMYVSTTTSDWYELLYPFGLSHVMRTPFSQNAESNLIHQEITLRLQAIYQKLGTRPSGSQGNRYREIYFVLQSRQKKS